MLVDLPPRGADVLPMPSGLGADAPMIPADSALDDLEVTREYDRSAVDEPVPGGGTSRLALTRCGGLRPPWHSRMYQFSKSCSKFLPPIPMPS